MPSILTAYSTVFVGLVNKKHENQRKTGVLAKNGTGVVKVFESYVWVLFADRKDRISSHGE